MANRMELRPALDPIYLMHVAITDIALPVLHPQPSFRSFYEAGSINLMQRAFLALESCAVCSTQFRLEKLPLDSIGVNRRHGVDHSLLYIRLT
jgi:hypothetical protein